MKKQNKTSIKPKYSLSDLINASHYLDEYSKKLENFIIGMERLSKERNEAWDNGKEIIKHLESSRKKAKYFRNEISKRLFTKKEMDAVRGSYKKISPKERIKNYIEAALKKGDIPKTDEKDKTDYRYMQNADYLNKLIDAIQDRLDSYNDYRKKDKKLKTKSTDELDIHIHTLTVLLKDTQAKLKQVRQKNFIKDRPEKQTIDHITKNEDGEEIDKLENLSAHSNYSDWENSDENPLNSLDEVGI